MSDEMLFQFNPSTLGSVEVTRILLEVWQVNKAVLWALIGKLCTLNLFGVLCLIQINRCAVSWKLLQLSA